MKNVFLLILLLTAISVTSLAQIKKGDWLAGGTGSGSKTSSYKWISLTPNAMYLATDKLAIGLSLGTSYSRSSNTGVPDSKYSSFSGGPIMRYYVPLNEKLVFFPEAKLSFGKTNAKTIVYDPGTGPTPFDYSTSWNSYSAGAGLGYFITPNVALEAILSYSSTSTKTKELDYDSDNSRFGLNLGFQIYLQKRSK